MNHWLVRTLFCAFFTTSCTSVPDYTKTVEKVELKRYMIKWYVIASRPTSFEEGAYNASEAYTFDAKTQQIDIDFSFNENSFTGPKKKIPQIGWVHNHQTFAHWKIKPDWWWFPFKLDYLIIGLDPNYEWTAVGDPGQKYLWIMSNKPVMAEEKLQEILAQVKAAGYNTDKIQRVLHNP